VKLLKVSKEEFLEKVDELFKDIRKSIGENEQAFTFMYLRELEEKIDKYFEKEKSTN